MQKDVVALNLRLPKDLHAVLEQLAVRHERSLQREILYALREYVAEQQAPR